MIPDIIEKMLSMQLKHLEKDGIVGRHVFPEVSPRLVYYLMNKGKVQEVKRCINKKK